MMDLTLNSFMVCNLLTLIHIAMDTKKNENCSKKAKSTTEE